MLHEVGHCINAHTFVTKLLEWAEKATFRDFTYRRETDSFRKLCLSVLLQRARPPQVDASYKRLFSVLPTMQDVARASSKQIAELIRPAGMYNVKAGGLQKLARILMDQHDGKVPQNRDELLRLPGIGEYAADVVLAWVFNQNVIMVDTNVCRVLKRVGLVKEEKEARGLLEKIVPEGHRKRFNLIIIEFGGLVCKPMKPLCYECVLREICQYAKGRSS